MNSEFKPLKWPPGRACKSTTNGHCYEAVLYKGQCGNFPTEFHRFLSKLTKTRKSALCGLIASTIRDATLGQLDPVTRDGYGDRTGEVEQLARGGHKILEVRLEERFNPPEELLPEKRLRLYFAEPDYPEIILFLLLEPKPVSGEGKIVQDVHIDEAVNRANDWWASSH
ncbi:hypothetical protein [Schaalia turicensis]|uniref:Uncharacterized protein n=1 Tax=Schaalia turicensis ACS-279-V-Col4 TaxID=883077 RepID=K0ZBP4_9ACTO|nr:hypothetical protein [Schaalia turicensis]EJZ84890.1 hypothetical protein HMPREF9241_01666 [Schaalia turicensis ACS-279-V-Col4]